MEREEYRRRNYYKRKRRRYRKIKRFVLGMALIVIGAGMLYLAFGHQRAERSPFVTENVSERKPAESISSVTENVDERKPDERNPEATVDLQRLYSPYAILIEADSGSCLAGKNVLERIYPASLTKIMTAVLAIENTEDMEEVITLPTDCFQELYEEGASMAGFQPGESACLKDLLYGILLPSGAECCVAFAERIGGSQEAFVEMMNQKAKELGMENTNFCNVTGLHDPEHYSTVEDIAVLLQYALKYDIFREAFSSSRYSVPPTEQHPEGFTFFSTMFSCMDSAEVTGGRIIGGKTGYTEEAGLCLASLAEVYGKEYILVTAKADGTHQTEPFHILDAMDVYNQIGSGGQ